MFVAELLRLDCQILYVDQVLIMAKRGNVTQAGLPRGSPLSLILFRRDRQYLWIPGVLILSHRVILAKVSDEWFYSFGTTTSLDCFPTLGISIVNRMISLNKPPRDITWRLYGNYHIDKKIGRYTFLVHWG